MTIPAGWERHPNDPKYMWNPQTGEVVLIPTAPTPQATSTLQIPGAEGWGEGDLNAMGADHAAIIVGGGGGETLYLDFPKIGPNIGDVVTMDIRFLPPWTVERRLPYVTYLRYRIPSRFWQNSDKQVEYVISYDSEGGPPGGCPIQKAINFCIERGNGEQVKGLKPRYLAAWQGIDINDSQRHWLQKKNQSGNVMLDANNQPIWEMHPGVITMGKTLHKAITRYWRKGCFFSIFEAGFALQLLKTRDGRDERDVTYDAIDIHPPCLFPEEFQPVLLNKINLQERMLNFRKAEEMEYCAQMIMQAYGTVSVTGPIPTNMASQGWVPHPSDPRYEWQQSTGAIRPATQVAAPAAPAVPAIPAVSPTPGLQQAAVQVPPAPPAARPPAPPGQHYPPAPSPYVPAAFPAPPAPPVAQAIPNVPPAPPVAQPAPPVAQPAPPVAQPAPPAVPLPPASAPGMPPAGAPGMPPTPPGPPPAQGTMSAQQLEAQFAASTGGGTPPGSPFDG